MAESQLSISATLQSELARIHAYMHKLAGSLMDILERLDERVELLVEHSSLGRNKVHQAPSAHESTKSVDIWRSLLPSMDGGSGRRSEFDVLKSSKARHDTRQDAEVAKFPPRELESVPMQRPVSDSGILDQEKLQTLTTKSLSPNADSLSEGENLPASTLPLQTPEATDMMTDINTKFVAIDRKLEQIAISMGVRGVTKEGDEEADRKRLKEKLKQAIEADRRSRIRTIVSQGEVWLEYMFGICQPDQRLGKRGSR